MLRFISLKNENVLEQISYGGEGCTKRIRNTFSLGVTSQISQRAVAGVTERMMSPFFAALFKKNWQCGSPVCLPSGQFVWEEAEEVQRVASYLERGHLAWHTDNSPTAQRAAVSQVLMQTLPWEPGRMSLGNKKKKKHKLLFSRGSFYLLVLLFPP